MSIEVIKCDRKLPVWPGFSWRHVLDSTYRSKCELEEMGFVDGKTEIGASQSREACTRLFSRVTGMSGQNTGHTFVEGCQATGAHGAKEIVLLREVVVGGRRRDVEGLGNRTKGHLVRASKTHLGQCLLDHRLRQGAMVVAARHAASNLDSVHMA